MLLTINMQNLVTVTTLLDRLYTCEGLFSFGSVLMRLVHLRDSLCFISREGSTLAFVKSDYKSTGVVIDNKVSIIATAPFSSNKYWASCLKALLA